MAQITLRLRAPADFDLAATVRSHGWFDLPPFRSPKSGELAIALEGCRATITGKTRGTPRLCLEARRPLSQAGRKRIVKTVESCLRFDLDLTEFWELCRADPDLAWAAERRAGRLLRAPTAFADAAMILATTNCSWALTRKITAALRDRYGEDGAFPTQEAIARAGAAELRRTVPMGYRAPYLAALARGLDLEDLRRDESPTPELRKRLLALPGFGPYAADTMLRLLGHFDSLALDSSVVKTWKRKYPRRKPTESAINRRLARYGKWKGLAFWLLCTSHWYAEEAFSL